MPGIFAHRVANESEVRSNLELIQASNLGTSNEGVFAGISLVRVMPYHAVRGSHHALRSNEIVGIRSHHINESRIVGVRVGYDVHPSKAAFVFAEAWDAHRAPLDLAAAGVYRYIEGNYDWISTLQAEDVVRASLVEEMRRDSEKHPSQYGASGADFDINWRGF